MGDAISRQDAIDAIVVWTVEDRPDIEMPTDLVDRVNALPSAERRGKWVNHRADDGHHIADCSICSNTLQWFDDEGGHFFCPNCGARMMEGADDAETVHNEQV